MNAPNGEPLPKRRSRLKRIVLYLFVFLVLLAVGAWFAIPPIISSDAGREKVRAALSEAFGRPVEVANLEFAWSTGLTVRGFALGEGEDALRARSLSADPELLSLLGDEIRLRKITIDGVELVVVRRVDGSFDIPALKSLREETAGPAKQDEASPLARLTVELAMTEFRLLIRDEAQGELLRFGPVSASAVLAKGKQQIPVRLTSTEEGFELTAEVDLLEGGRMRPMPTATGVLSFTGMELARYARIAAIVGHTEGLAGELTGTIGFRVTSADRQSVDLDFTIRNGGAASVSLVGEGRMKGSVQRTGEALTASGLALTFPGGNVRLEELRQEGDRSSVRGRLDVDMAVLAAALRGIDLPDNLEGKGEFVLLGEMVGSAWSARIDGVATSASGRPLVPTLPDLGNRMVVTGRIAGDRDLTALRIVEPLVLTAGPETVTLTGEILDPKSDDRKGRIDAAIRGPLLKPAIESLAEARMGGRLEGDLAVNLSGGKAILSGELSLLDLILASPGMPEFREPRVRIRPHASYAFADGSITISNATMDAQGLNLNLSGHLVGVPADPRGTGKLVITGDLARIPATLFPVGFAGRGLISATLEITDPTRGRIDVTGQGIVLTGVPGVPGEVRADRLVSQTNLLWAEGAELPRLGDGRIEVPAATVTWTGLLDPAGAVDLIARATVNIPNLVRDHAGLFPEGLAATGTANAKLSLQGDLTEATALDLTRGSAQVELARATFPGYELTGGTFALTLGQRQVRITKGEAMLNGGPAKITGGADLRVDPVRLDFAVNTERMKLTRTMEPQAKYLVPLFGNAARLSGLIDLQTDLQTSGTDGDSLLKGLTGTANLKVNDGSITGSPILSILLRWLGEPEDLKFTNIGGTLRFDQGRVGTDDLLLTAANVTLRFRGYTGLDGTLDYQLGVKLPPNSGRASQFAALLGRDGFIPLALGGTFTAPKLKPPELKAEDLKEAAGDLLKRKLEDLLKKR